MTGLALGILIAVGVAGVWDILDPDALKLDFNSGARAVFALVASLASMILCLMVLQATAAAVAIVAAAYICLVVIGAWAKSL